MTSHAVTLCGGGGHGNRRGINKSVCGYATVARMEGELSDIEALKDLKVELISQKEVSPCRETTHSNTKTT